jgi:MFS transporter, DHA1 family, inner membrane transport protein
MIDHVLSSTSRRATGPQILALTVMLITGTASTMIMPIIANIFVTQGGVSPDRIGYFVAFELLCLAFGALATTRWIDRFPPKRFSAVAATLFCVANLCCPFVRNVSLLVALRASVGLVSGSLNAFSLAAASRASNANRVFPIIYTAMSLQLMVLFLIIPMLQARWGESSTFVLLSVVGGIMLCLSPLVQIDKADHSIIAPADTSRKGLSMDATLLLAAWFLFQVGQVGIWVYSERVAAVLGFDFAAINYLYAAVCTLSIFAAMLSGWIDGRVSKAVSLVAVVLASALTILAMAFIKGAGLFVADFLIYGCVLYFAYPFFSTLAAEIDPTGRTAGLLPAGQALGAAAGPALTSLVLQGSGDLHRVSLVNGLISMLALVVFLPALRADARRTRAMLRH